ncbi:hypothetical protein HYZ41_00650 [archaeon]|nr:hypothetical protein [archaeon]
MTTDNSVNRQKVYEYYSDKFIVDQLMKNSKGREVAGAFWNGTYDRRPNILQYSTDVTQMVRNGVTSFHFSVERWSNPMAIADEKSYEKLRNGWDLIFDIDSKLGLDESKTAADLICKLLEKYGIKNYGVKFSGRRGFHICIPWIMFPKTIDYKPAAKMYPGIPRIVARFVRKKIKHQLMAELIKSKGAKQLIKKNIVLWEGRISEEYFPPCIKNILSGITDGRKRSIFTLVNFLRMANWQWDEIEQKIIEWNENNVKPLPRTIVVGQLRWSQRNMRNPANCPPDGDLFYGDTVNVCKPDNICKQGTTKILIKNPIVYPFKVMKIKRKKKISRGYTCGVCGKDFKNMRSLNMHKGRSHGYTYDI